MSVEMGCSCVTRSRSCARSPARSTDRVAVAQAALLQQRASSPFVERHAQQAVAIVLGRRR